MRRVMLEDIGKHLECQVLVKGWVSRIRKLGAITFIILRDATGCCQLVLESGAISDIRNEDLIEVKGLVSATGQTVSGFEIKAEDYKIISKSKYENMPIMINGAEINARPELIFDNRFLSLRNPRIMAIFKLQHHITAAFRQFFSRHAFTEIHTPKIVASGTEGGTELFTIDYFGRAAYLAQSPQLYKQMMVGAGFERVYELGHVYRAEPHETSRHLNEYVSMDVEMGFINSEQDLIVIETEFLQYLYTCLETHCGHELSLYEIELPAINTIPQYSLREAQTILKDHFGKWSPEGNLDTDGEKLFSQYVKNTTGSDFVYVTEYPAVKRPFYTMPQQYDNTLTKSFDLLYKGMEITSGGQRIHDYDQLCSSIERHGMKPSWFKFYLEAFKFGMPPHGGFAIGLERLTMKLLGLANVKEASLLPRDRNRLVP